MADSHHTIVTPEADVRDRANVREGIYAAWTVGSMLKSIERLQAVPYYHQALNDPAVVDVNFKAFLAYVKEMREKGALNDTGFSKLSEVEMGYWELVLPAWNTQQIISLVWALAHDFSSASTPSATLPLTNGELLIRSLNLLDRCVTGVCRDLLMSFNGIHPLVKVVESLSAYYSERAEPIFCAQLQAMLRSDSSAIRRRALGVLFARVASTPDDAWKAEQRQFFKGDASLPGFDRELTLALQEEKIQEDFVLTEEDKSRYKAQLVAFLSNESLAFLPIPLLWEQESVNVLNTLALVLDEADYPPICQPQLQEYKTRLRTLIGGDDPPRLNDIPELLEKNSLLSLQWLAQFDREYRDTLTKYPSITQDMSDEERRVHQYTQTIVQAAYEAFAAGPENSLLFKSRCQIVLNYRSDPAFQAFRKHQEDYRIDEPFIKNFFAAYGEEEREPRARRLAQRAYEAFTVRSDWRFGEKEWEEFTNRAEMRAVVEVRQGAPSGVPREMEVAASMDVFHANRLLIDAIFMTTPFAWSFQLHEAVQLVFTRIREGTSSPESVQSNEYLLIKGSYSSERVRKLFKQAETVYRLIYSDGNGTPRTTPLNRDERHIAFNFLQNLPFNVARDRFLDCLRVKLFQSMDLVFEDIVDILRFHPEDRRVVFLKASLDLLQRAITTLTGFRALLNQLRQEDRGEFLKSATALILAKGVIDNTKSGGGFKEVLNIFGREEGLFFTLQEGIEVLLLALTTAADVCAIREVLGYNTEAAAQFSIIEEVLTAVEKVVVGAKSTRELAEILVSYPYEGLQKLLGRRGVIEALQKTIKTVEDIQMLKTRGYAFETESLLLMSEGVLKATQEMIANVKTAEGLKAILVVFPYQIQETLIAYPVSVAALAKIIKTAADIRAIQRQGGWEDQMGELLFASEGVFIAAERVINDRESAEALAEVLSLFPIVNRQPFLARVAASEGESKMAADFLTILRGVDSQQPGCSVGESVLTAANQVMAGISTAEGLSGVLRVFPSQAVQWLVTAPMAIEIIPKVVKTSQDLDRCLSAQEFFTTAGIFLAAEAMLREIKSAEELAHVLSLFPQEIREELLSKAVAPLRKPTMAADFLTVFENAILESSKPAMSDPIVAAASKILIDIASAEGLKRVLSIFPLDSQNVLASTPLLGEVLSRIVKTVKDISTLKNGSQTVSFSRDHSRYEYETYYRIEDHVSDETLALLWADKGMLSAVEGVMGSVKKMSDLLYILFLFPHEDWNSLLSRVVAAAERPVISAGFLAIFKASASVQPGSPVHESFLSDAEQVMECVGTFTELREVLNFFPPEGRWILLATSSARDAMRRGVNTIEDFSIRDFSMILEMVHKDDVSRFLMSDAASAVVSKLGSVKIGADDFLEIIQKVNPSDRLKFLSRRGAGLSVFEHMVSGYDSEAVPGVLMQTARCLDVQSLSDFFSHPSIMSIMDYINEKGCSNALIGSLNYFLALAKVRSVPVAASRGRTLFFHITAGRPSIWQSSFDLLSDPSSFPTSDVFRDRVVRPFQAVFSHNRSLKSRMELLCEELDKLAQPQRRNCAIL